jgi:type II secretory pathway pseudopilin PulG
VRAERRRRKAPRWARWIGRKVLGWLIAILLLAIAATVAYRHFFPSDDAQTSAEVAAHGGGTYHTNQILANSPHGAVHAIYDLIGKPISDPEKRAELVCGSMTAEAQVRFASDLGFPDCRQATIDLHAQVQPAQLNQYIYAVPAAATDPLGTHVTIYSCWYTISGGPSLGTFVVEKREKGQWLIVGHEKDPAACPPKPTEPTTTPTR